MAKVGGGRNYGFGKQLTWAGRQAIQNRYGEGHFASVEAHGRRWEQFVNYLKDEQIRDARYIEMSDIRNYVMTLREQVAEGSMSVSYAQNLLSTVNVVLEEMRGDQSLRISPSEEVGERSFVREDPPAWMDRDAVSVVIDDLHKEVPDIPQELEPELAPLAEELIASQIELAREFGLRWRETILADAQRLYPEAQSTGSVSISEGTKGGREREIQLHHPHQFEVLERAANLQERLSSTCFVRWGQNYRQYSESASRLYYSHGGHHFHDLRAAYACERYQELTGYPAPCIAGKMLASREADLEARQIITGELGHGRIDVVAAYIGGRS